MPKLKVDVLLTTEPADAGVRAGRLASLGVDGAFSFESAHDAFFPLVLAAGAVADGSDLDLMTNVALAFTRSPLHLAYAANDMQLLSKGRFRLGLGSQVRVHIERRWGATWSRPVARMRETIEAIHAIFAAWERREAPQFRGEFFTHTLMTPNFSPGPNPYGRPPVLVGALGPRMTEMAAEVADGILVMPFNSRRHFVERTVPAIDRGLAAADRKMDSFEVICEAIVALGESESELEAAQRGVRNLLAFYGSTPAYRPVLEVEGWQDLQPELNTLSKRGRWAQMADLIDQEMLETLAVVGTAEDCAQQIVQRYGAEADRVCCYFPGYSVPDERIAGLVASIHHRATT